MIHCSKHHVDHDWGSFMQVRAKSCLFRQTTLSVCLGLCFVLAAQEALAARVGGGSSGGYSRSSGGSSYSGSHSYSNTRTSYGSSYGNKSSSTALPAPTNTTSSARLGSSQSMGVQRPANTGSSTGTGTGMVMGGTGGNTAMPVTTNRAPITNQTNTAQQGSDGKRSWVAPAVVGAAAGAALGYAIGHSGNDKAQQAPAPQQTGMGGMSGMSGGFEGGNTGGGGGGYYPPQVGQAAGVAPAPAPMPAPMAPAQPQNSGGTNWFLWLLLAGGAFWAWKRGLFARFFPGTAAAGNTGSNGNSARTIVAPPVNGLNDFRGNANTFNTFDGVAENVTLNQTEFVNRAGRCFDLLQLANREGDTSALNDFATPEMADLLRPQLQHADGSGSRVERLGSTVIEWLPQEKPPFASIRFEAVSHNPNGKENFAEIWNFQHLGGDWRLAGIEQSS